MVDIAGDSNKPIAIGECWELPAASQLANEKLWSFFMSWSELTFQWPNTDASIRKLYNSDEVITLDAMPGWLNTSTGEPNDEISNREHFSETWSVEATADGGIVVDLGSDHVINRIQLHWKDILNHKAPVSGATNATEDVASVYVSDDHGDIRIKGKSNNSAWELLVSNTRSVSNSNSVPAGSEAGTNAPTVAPRRVAQPTTRAPAQSSSPTKIVTKAPTKTLFEPIDPPVSSPYEISSVASSPTKVDTFIFMSIHDTYLCAYNGGIGLQASNEEGYKEYERWEKLVVGSKVALRSSSGTFLSAWWDGSVKMADHLKGWELWTEVINDDGSVSFLSYHDNYLSAWPDGIVRLSGQNIGWERFREERVVVYE